MLDKVFASGISLANATIFNLETNKIEHSFKVMDTSSKEVSYFSY
jgi:hypothetical protein